MPELNRWRCDRHEEGPVLMSSPHRPVCWCCRAPMDPHTGTFAVTDAPFTNPLLAHIHSLGG